MSELPHVIEAQKVFAGVLEQPPTAHVKAVADVLALVTSPRCNDARSLDRQVAAVLWARDIVMRGGAP